MYRHLQLLGLCSAKHTFTPVSTVRELTSLGKEQPGPEEVRVSTAQPVTTSPESSERLCPSPDPSARAPRLRPHVPPGTLGGGRRGSWADSAPLGMGFCYKLRHLPWLPALQPWPESSDLAPLPCDLCHVRNQPELIHVLFLFPSVVRISGSPMSLKTSCSPPLRTAGWTGMHRPSWGSHALYRRRTSTRTF